MRDALNATGRPIYFSLCGWNSWYAPPGATLGNSWRIAGDCNAWPSILNAIKTNEPLAPDAKIGGWNDPGFASPLKFTATQCTRDSSHLISQICWLAVVRMQQYTTRLRRLERSSPCGVWQLLLS